SLLIPHSLYSHRFPAAERHGPPHFRPYPLDPCKPGYRVCGPPGETKRCEEASGSGKREDEDLEGGVGEILGAQADPQQRRTVVGSGCSRGVDHDGLLDVVMAASVLFTGNGNRYCLDITKWARSCRLAPMPSGATPSSSTGAFTRLTQKVG